MSHPFYAIHKEIHDEVAIFNTEKERDEWVDFKDQLSIDLGINPEDPIFHREKITEEEADAYTCGNIYDRGTYIDDCYNDNMKWTAAPGTPLWEV